MCIQASRHELGAVRWVCALMCVSLLHITCVHLCVCLCAAEMHTGCCKVGVCAYVQQRCANLCVCACVCLCVCACVCD